jgi:hypothetical protein
MEKQNNTKKCPICKIRQETIDELDKCKTPTERESKRTATYDINKNEFITPGKRDELKECCGKIIGSYTDNYGEDKNKTHHHRCEKCGKRYPETGSYNGEWVNDNLKSDNPKFAIIGTTKK